GINGLAYNPADNSIIATQQWGGANSDGYINKFTANGLNPITATDVYDFKAAPVISFQPVTSDKGTSDTFQLWCYPSGDYSDLSIDNYSGNFPNPTCVNPNDTGVIVGINYSTKNMPSPSGANYSADVDSYNWSTGNLWLDNKFAYINFEDILQNNNQNVQLCYYYDDSIGDGNSGYFYMNSCK
ncbi:MAG: hypothetical protein RL017_348, partial [Pseudomonadota bacterium]